MTRLALGIGLAVLLASTPARAALTLCNRTSYVLYAATAAINGPQAQTQGWTRIVPGECQVARKEDLIAGKYLVHARSSLAHSGPARAWGGNFPLCVKDTNFSLGQPIAAKACKADGSFTLPFAVVNTGGSRNWTMTLDETPALTSLTAAQLPGVRRLLRDNGYQTGPLDGRPDKQTGAALAAFRKRAHLPERTDNTGLFVALEAAAAKANAPSGYTVCNDGAATVEVALGQTGQGKVSSRGWWTVAPHGACARLLTKALTADALYLFARHKDGKALVTGAEKFCIAPAAFEISQRGDCAGHRQGEAGFVQTVTDGRAGIIVHVGNAGLLAPSEQPPIRR